MHVENSRDLIILEQIEQNPDATQASLAGEVGVAVGTINWHIKRLVNKGYIKVKRAERKKLKYIITPEGISLRARLTIDYIQNQFSLYRLTREKVSALLAQVQAEGHSGVRLIGDGDVADVCRLTCLEQSISILDDPKVPAIIVHGIKVYLQGVHGQG
ncbi:MAG: winged helix-turn-helix transcriptional regulator [Anaerolineaceae bacterium]|nr:winged helix-turn-helix transcriptional regulator [Anaerolineaceae bacterium]